MDADYTGAVQVMIYNAMHHKTSALNFVILQKMSYQRNAETATKIFGALLNVGKADDVDEWVNQGEESTTDRRKEMPRSLTNLPKSSRTSV